jgi:hypothetical protein
MYNRPNRLSVEKTPAFQPRICRFSNQILTKTISVILTLPIALLGQAAEAGIIKKYDFESGNFSGVSRQYQDITCSKNSSYIDGSLFQIVDAPGGRGGKAVKHQIKNCDERSELVVGGGLMKSGQSYWLGWSMYLPKNHNQPGRESFTITQQMGFYNTCWQNSRGENCNNLIENPDGSIVPKIGSPIHALLPSVDGLQLQYHLYPYLQTDAQGRHLFRKKLFTLPSVTDRWQDFVMYLNLSSDPKRARVKLWKDDKLYIKMAARIIPPGVSAMGDWKIGAYVGDPGRGERTIYIDEVRVGDSTSNYFEVVAPARRRQPLITSLAAAKLMPSPTSSIEPAAVPEPNLSVGLLALGSAALYFSLKRD